MPPKLRSAVSSARRFTNLNTRLIDDVALARVYVEFVRPLLFEYLSAGAAPELFMVGGQ